LKPKILIDAIALLSPLTGIGRYTYEVSAYLRSKDDFELDFFYGYISKELQEPSRKSSMKSLKSIIVKNSFIKMLARKILIFSGKIFFRKYDLYWQPNFIPNKNIEAKKTVVTVHDFSCILYKDFHPKEHIEYFENNFFQNIVLSDFIITGSHYTKKEILERVDFDEKKIKVIYHGIDHKIFKVRKELSTPLKLPKKFILSVGSIEPRKNLIGLLKAYNILEDRIKKEYKLVLVGFKGWENDEMMNLIKKNKNNVSYLGFISDEELAKVYNLASLFVFPSFYEGFGLPPLEALACGTPVASSNTSSMPEICKDAALYFDPYNIQEIKEKIELLLGDEMLQKSLVQTGLQRVKNFAWEKSAKEHLTVFKKVLQG